MNAQIRKAVRIELVRQDMQQRDLARITGMSQQHVSGLITGRSGNLPEGWEKIFEALGLELVVVPKEQQGLASH
jgi:transcriptional regulator with XRE-family HTH domain